MLEAVIGITAGLLLTALLAVAPPSRRSGPQRRALAGAGLVYAVLVVPLAVRSGVVAWSLLALAALLAATVAVAWWAGRRAPAESSQGEALQALVATGLLAAVLAGAGQTLSLLSRVDPRATIIVVAAVAVLAALLGRLAGTVRAASAAVTALAIAVVPVMAIGLFLGDPGGLATATVPVPGPTLGAAVSLAVVLLVLAAADPLLAARTADASGATVARGAAILAVLVLLLGVGLLLFFDGSIIGPSLQLFTLPANLDVVPGPMLLLLLALTLLLAASAAALLAAVAGVAPASSIPAWTIGCAAVAVVIALLGAPVEALLVSSALLAAGLAGGLLPGGAGRTGIVAGAGAAAVAVVGLALLGDLRLGWPTAIGVVLVAVVSVVAGRVGSPAVAAG